jgi:hypothetical protein
MAKRILLGKAGSDYGLFVSKAGIDVVNNSNVLTSSENLLFDSRVGIGSLPLKFHGQGTISAPAVVGIPASTTITHSLNYKPLVIVQWCFSTDVSNGIATKMYPAMYFNFFEDDYNSDYGISEEEYESRLYGGVGFQVTTTTLVIKNYFSGGTKEYIVTGQGASQEIENISPLAINYAFLIFDVEGV